MKESPPLLHALLGLKQASSNRALSQVVDIKSMMDVLPISVMLVDSSNMQILSGNSHLSDLTGYTYSELAGLHLTDLFNNWHEETLTELVPNHPKTSKVVTEVYSNPNLHLFAEKLTRRHQPPVDVDLTCSVVHPKETTILIILEPTPASAYHPDQNQDLPQQHSADEYTSQTWEVMNSLLSAVQEHDFISGLELVLHAGTNVTGAKVLAIYKIEERTPRLQFYLGTGETKLLPQELPLKELVHLNQPGQWRIGNRTSCTLYQMARTAGLSSIATTPIGLSNAMVGLVVVGDDKVSPNTLTLPFVQLLANVIGSIFQQQSRLTNIQSDLTRQASELKAKATLEENMHEGIVLLDPTLKIIKLNQAAEMTLGYASREVVGQPVEKLLIGPETLFPALTSAQEGNPSYNLGNVKLYKRNGDAFLALIRVIPVVNDHQVEEIIVLIEDRSEQEQIRLQTEQLEQRALLGEVTAIFAHEVRNPINNISTGLQVMLMNLSEGSPNHGTVMGMLQDCERLADLMNSVLAFSRPTDYEMEKLDMPILLNRLLDRLRPRIAKLNVKYDLKAEFNCPPIQGNMRALEQVFSNLITNALHAMGEKGGNLVLKVQPSTTYEGSVYLEVSVADTGPGIPKEIQEKLFQPFFTTDKSHGTGLGLAIAKRIVIAHQGNIWLESFPVGTVFHVQIPAITNNH